MSESVIFPKPSGATYSIPDVGDFGWGQAVTDFLVAIPNGVVPTSGTFTLTGDVNFGASFGLLSKYFTSLTANAASAGVFRLANAENVAWRNAANSGNNLLSVNASDQLTYNGNPLASGGTISNIVGTAFQISVSGGTGPTATLSLPTNLIVPGTIIANGNITIESGHFLAFSDFLGNAAVGIKALPSTAYTLIWPTAQGAAGANLQNDGSGQLSWVAAPIGVGGAGSVPYYASTGAALTSNPLASFSSGPTGFLQLGDTGGTSPGGLRLSSGVSGGFLEIDPAAGGNAAQLHIVMANFSTTGGIAYTIPDAGTSSSFVLDHGNSNIVGQITLTEGTSDSTRYPALTIDAGGGGAGSIQSAQTTTGVSTSAATIFAPSTLYTFALVAGSDGTNRFFDMVLMSVNTGTVNVVSSLNTAGSPGTRTYSQSSNMLKLAMSAGTYTTQVQAIEMSGR